MHSTYSTATVLLEFGAESSSKISLGRNGFHCWVRPDDCFHMEMRSLMGWSVDRCPFAHETCPTNCQRFTDCSTGARINTFLSNGFTWSGENIAAGNAASLDTMVGISLGKVWHDRNTGSVQNQWLGSAGHCTNIFSSGSIQLGTGYASGTNTFRHYWTQVTMWMG